ncbi:TIGR03560 family F420-dependent LLM class oxidoreductase [Candidatus Poriferisodalis sp.]|uniref:TIGR03560 family F420-dependent LLM class oxidoreductase n=1 Tax=Candidatus Poriferisodalis sp. TaxID=3101277 RepID=UPI003B0189ED
MGRHAIKTPPHHAAWPEYLTLWQLADEMEVIESAWNWDHFYPLAPPYDGPNLEGWTMLAALAQATERIRIGAMVNGMHHRHPAVTANMAATLDHISNGRFELGMGAGWNFMESDAYGIDLGPLRDRSDRLEEGMEVIVKLLTESMTTHKGRFFELTDAWCEPKPVQDRIPIVIGGSGRVRTLRTAAKYADQWDMLFPDDVAAWQELDGVLQAHCERVGRDQAEIDRSIHLSLEAGDVVGAVAGAQEFFDAGVDIVVWSWRGELDPGRLDALATAIDEA